MKRVRLIIYGDVQGVSFRSWTRWQAQELGVVGWVKNREDGSVEVVAEGGDLKEFVKRCRKGPEVAWIENVDIAWEAATGEFSDFRVVY